MHRRSGIEYQGGGTSWRVESTDILSQSCYWKGYSYRSTRCQGCRCDENDDAELRGIRTLAEEDRDSSSCVIDLNGLYRDLYRRSAKVDRYRYGEQPLAPLLPIAFAGDVAT